MAGYVAIAGDGTRTGFDARDDDEARYKVRRMLGQLPCESCPGRVDIYRDGELISTIHAPLSINASYGPHSGEHGRMYRGPVRKVSTIFEGDVAEHCPRCGSTEVYATSHDGGRCCERCRCCFRLDDGAPEGSPLYLVDQEGGYGRVVPYDRVFDGLADIYDELDPVKTEYPARDYFGPGYDTLSDYALEDSDLQSALDKGQWDYSLYLTETDYLLDRQLNGLGVGESYKFPDYPVKVTRVQNRRSKKKGRKKGRRHRIRTSPGHA